MEQMLSLTHAELRRLSRRAIEVAGQVETVDFLIGLPDPVYRQRLALQNDLALLVEKLEAAFSHHDLFDWLFVSPEAEWLKRLRKYHLLKAGVPLNADFSRETSAIRIIDHLAEIGFPVAEPGPGEILPLLAERFPKLALLSLPATIESYASYSKDSALLITSCPRIFGAWQGIMASPLASCLPKNWEMQLGKYGHLIPSVLHHLCPEPFITEAPANP